MIMNGCIHWFKESTSFSSTNAKSCFLFSVLLLIIIIIFRWLSALFTE